MLFNIAYSVYEKQLKVCNHYTNGNQYKLDPRLDFRTHHEKFGACIKYTIIHNGVYDSWILFFYLGEIHFYFEFSK